MPSYSKPPTPGVVAYILSPACDSHIEWLKKVFGAEQLEMYRTKDQTKVMHCSMKVNDGVLSLADNTCTMEPDTAPPPGADKVMVTHGFWCHVETPNPKELWKVAMENGSTVVFNMEKQYWGGELGCFRDPFGFHWGVTKAGDCRRPGVVPYLFKPDGECVKHIEWMEKALGATKKYIHLSEDQTIVQHCMLEINGAPFYISDISGLPPNEEGRKEMAGKLERFFCHMDVKDPHALWKNILNQEANIAMELKKQFWGDLYGMIKDPFDFEWGISELKEPAEQACRTRGVLPYLFSPDCEKHIEWIKDVFGAEVKNLMRASDGKKVMHSWLKVNDGSLFICDASVPCDQQDFQPRPKSDPSGYLCHMNVPDPDEIWKKAMARGATQIAELKVQFWGDYYGSFRDPFGFEWAVMKA